MAATQFRALAERSAPSLRAPRQGLDRPAIGQGALPLSDYAEAGIGPIVVGAVWLMFYLVAAAHALAFGN
jgi:hypothetical protein